MKFTDLIPGKIYFQEYTSCPYKYIFLYEKTTNKILYGSFYINADNLHFGGGNIYVNGIKDSSIRLATNDEINSLCEYHKLDPTLFLQTSYEIY